MDLYQPGTPSNRESIEVSYYQTLRQMAHDGLFYTISTDKQNNDKHDRFLSNAHVDPFTSMPTYSQRYRKEQRTFPRLDSNSYGQ